MEFGKSFAINPFRVALLDRYKSDVHAANVLVKLIRKLRWTKVEEETTELQKKLEPDATEADSI